MNKVAEPQPRRTLLPDAIDMRELDSIDNCRMRLLALRTRIEHNWPEAGGRFFNRRAGLSDESLATIRDLLVALPTPLPVHAGQEPECIISDTETDLHLASGRAVDAALALLEDRTLETRYPGQVTMLEASEAGAPEPIVVSQPTVGLLVATMIGTLEAISEEINEPSPVGKRRKAAPAQPAPPQPAAPTPAGPEAQADSSPAAKPSGRGPSVPRI
jgi:hypothetical protein